MAPRAPKAISGLPARLIPNARWLMASLTLVWCFTLFDGAHQLFRDSDAGWHIRTGERILSTGQLPYADPYSFSRAGRPWFAWEWGADVLMGASHRMLGLPGVALLYGAALAAVTWLWLALQFQAGASFLPALLTIPLMFSTANLHWLARPHVFGWLFLLGTILWCERGARRPGGALLLGAAWANIHASFFLGPVVFLIYAAFRGGKYWTAALLAGLGTFFNPYGYHVHQHVVAYLANGELLRRIGEFQTFNFQLEGAAQIVLCFAICGIGAVLALVEKRYEWALLIGLFWLIALRSARGLPVLAVSVLPLAVAAISIWSRRAYPRLSGFFRYSDNLRAIDRGLSGAWVMVPALALAMAMASKAGFAATEFPVNAVAAIPAGARLFAPDKFGGYVIYRTSGAQPVFFDGRSDFYGVEFMKDYIRMVEVRPGWQALFDAWHFTHALVPVDAPLRAALEARGWQTLSVDKAAVLMAPR
ncbi:MAG: hypothetical protein NTZ56_01930 [Acidobacteria bacterium]|nr:hypothetical protein [Acidobacteriota bacterium]